MKAKTYHEWFLRQQEKLMAELAEEGGRTKEADEAMTVEVVRYSHLKNFILSGENQPDILIACDDDGELAEYAVSMIRAFFAEHPDINMVYGDEDQVSDGVHVSPWLVAGYVFVYFLFRECIRDPVDGAGSDQSGQAHGAGV